MRAICGGRGRRKCPSICRLDRKVRTFSMASRDRFLRRSDRRAEPNACPLAVARKPSARLPAGYVQAADSRRDLGYVENCSKQVAHDEELAARRYERDPALDPVLPAPRRRGRTNE